MTHFLLIPGGGGAGHVWHHVAAALTARGQVALPVDLPAEDPDAGLEAYADHAAAAALAFAGPEQEWTVVGMSLGAFTAPLLASRIVVGALVLVNPMIPAPGETAGEWWAATGQGDAMAAAARIGGYPADFDLEMFFHDVTPDDREALTAHEGDEAAISFAEPFGPASWPDVPTQIIASAADRLFPADFVARLAHDRLGLPTTVVPGGHLSPLSQPEAVVSALLAP